MANAYLRPEPFDAIELDLSLCRQEFSTSRSTQRHIGCASVQGESREKT